MTSLYHPNYYFFKTSVGDSMEAHWNQNNSILLKIFGYYTIMNLSTHAENKHKPVNNRSLIHQHISVFVLRPVLSQYSRIKDTQNH